MKNLFTFFFAIGYIFQINVSIAQTLGTYPDATVIAGQNTTVTPSVSPTNTTSIVAYTNTNFTGILSVNPVTGMVTVTDAKQAGTYTVEVKAFGSGTATQTFILNVTDPLCSQAYFIHKTNISVGNKPTSIAIGDFNEDGKQDFATANEGGNVSIRLGDGMGGFSGISNVFVGSANKSIAIGDFNGDGKQDLAATNPYSDNVSIHIGDGNGGFGSGSKNQIENAYSIAIGDFNGDGNQDFAISNWDSYYVSIRLGDGRGGFSGSTNIAVGSSPYSVAIGDFNEDGKQDLATASYTSDNVSIRLGDGRGGFDGGTNIAVGRGPISVAIGDFNKDNKQDLITANYWDYNVSIRLGDGNGEFSGSTNIAVGSYPYSVAIGDFNGDGDQDFAVANVRSNNVSIRLGDGRGGFSGSNNIKVGVYPISVAIGDFNSDGIQDFASANWWRDSVSIHLGGASEINIQGNSTNIVDGDNSPSTADHTDFGSITPGTTLTRTFTVQNTGTTLLTINSIVSSNPLFVVSGTPTSVVEGESATFMVTFSPTAAGIQKATITINNDDCDEAVYDFAVKGTGTGITTWYRDNDGDGWGRTQNPIISAAQPRGYVNQVGDCNDGDPTIFLGAPELSDGKDNNCDGQVDEGLACRVIWYKDADGDGRGRTNLPKQSCIKPVGYVNNANDCNDGDGTIYLGAPELCDGKDNDCDGKRDEGCGLITGTSPAAKADIETEAYNINIWPNPARSELMVSLNGITPNQKLEMVMLTADGRVVQSQSIMPVSKDQLVRLDVKGLATAYYLLRISQEQLMQTKKVMIVR